MHRCRIRLFALLLCAAAAGLRPGAAHFAGAQPAEEPLRLAVVGLTHGHAGGFLSDLARRDDVRLVGLYDPDPALLAAYGDRFRTPPALRYTDLDALLDRSGAEAVAVFTDTYAHPEIVERAAARGLHVMMEKPLAVSTAHAERIRKAAGAAGVHVLVNYETTWYPALHALYALAAEAGPIRKMIAYTGHQGPREIGVGPEFLGWLTDPARNGGGALTDFGCYGANVMTWLMRNERPLSVTATLQQLKTDSTYARVDDEANIVLAYPHASGVIQASWNWTFNRKDFELYGDRLLLSQTGRSALLTRRADGSAAAVEVAPIEAPHADPLSYLRAVVRGRIRPEGLSSLENNLIVTEILEAARTSAQTGRTVRLAGAASE